ncbi:MAG: hypothetical protein J1F31_03615 [Erysipelotrichales bacterium]|nr:hypothetical protein [Erysipelotrichales bacterium]
MKTKEQNELLSYVHMAASLFRQYAQCANNLETKDFLNKIIEKFSKHESEIKSRMHIEKEGNVLSIMQNMIVCMKKMQIKTIKDSFEICVEALKTLHMAIYQLNRYIRKNINVLNDEFIGITKYLLKEYEGIEKELRDFIKTEYLF